MLVAFVAILVTVYRVYNLKSGLASSIHFGGLKWDKGNQSYHLVWNRERLLLVRFFCHTPVQNHLGHTTSCLVQVSLFHRIGNSLSLELYFCEQHAPFTCISFTVYISGRNWEQMPLPGPWKSMNLRTESRKVSQMSRWVSTENSMADQLDLSLSILHQMIYVIVEQTMQRLHSSCICSAGWHKKDKPNVGQHCVRWSQSRGQDWEEEAGVGEKSEKTAEPGECQVCYLQ